ncbi:hypothetical protein MRX96_011592 [Rhipicephalus microplus]
MAYSDVSQNVYGDLSTGSIATSQQRQSAALNDAHTTGAKIVMGQFPSCDRDARGVFSRDTARPLSPQQLPDFPRKNESGSGKKRRKEQNADSAARLSTGARLSLATARIPTSICDRVDLDELLHETDAL